MKKLLALVLALVMSMFIVTISNAAFSDAADIDYKEAVDVLAAVGVLEGPDGKFDPKAELTREQAAKIIAYLDLGIRMNKISFEDADMQDDGEQINTYDMSYECQDLQSVATMTASLWMSVTRQQSSWSSLRMQAMLMPSTLSARRTATAGC